MQRISFANPQIFGRGYLAYRRNLRCTIMNMIMKGVLNYDGSVDVTAFDKVGKKELWVYIYYIWKTNYEKIQFFQQMCDPKYPARASAEQFVMTVRHYLRNQYPPIEANVYIEKKELITFINKIILDYRPDLPVLTLLFQRLEQSLNQKEIQLMRKISNVNNATAAATNAMKLRSHGALINTSTGLQTPIGIAANRNGYNVKVNVKV